MNDLEYLCQALVLFVVVVSAICNLATADKEEDRPLWASLLSVCVGLCVPGPTSAALRRWNRSPTTSPPPTTTPQGEVVAVNTGDDDSNGELYDYRDDVIGIDEPDDNDADAAEQLQHGPLPEQHDRGLSGTIGARHAAG